MMKKNDYQEMNQLHDNKLLDCFIKNWIKIDQKSYLDIKSNQFISKQRVEVGKEKIDKEIQFYRNRIKDSRQNVVKMVFFQINYKGVQQQRGTYAIDVYIQGLVNINKPACLCQGIIKGFSNISQLYGYIRVKPQMIWLKKTAKQYFTPLHNSNVRVWMNQIPFLNESIQTTQGQMVFDILHVLTYSNYRCPFVFDLLSKINTKKQLNFHHLILQSLKLHSPVQRDYPLSRHQHQQQPCLNKQFNPGNVGVNSPRKISMMSLNKPMPTRNPSTSVSFKINQPHQYYKNHQSKQRKLQHSPIYNPQNQQTQLSSPNYNYIKINSFNNKMKVTNSIQFQKKIVPNNGIFYTPINKAVDHRLPSFLNTKLNNRTQQISFQNKNIKQCEPIKSKVNNLKIQSVYKIEIERVSNRTSRRISISPTYQINQKIDGKYQKQKQQQKMSSGIKKLKQIQNQFKISQNQMKLSCLQSKSYNNFDTSSNSNNNNTLEKQSISTKKDIQLQQEIETLKISQNQRRVISQGIKPYNFVNSEEGHKNQSNLIKKKNLAQELNKQKILNEKQISHQSIIKKQLKNLSLPSAIEKQIEQQEEYTINNNLQKNSYIKSKSFNYNSNIYHSNLNFQRGSKDSKQAQNDNRNFFRKYTSKFKPQSSQSKDKQPYNQNQKQSIKNCFSDKVRKQSNFSQSMFLIYENDQDHFIRDKINMKKQRFATLKAQARQILQ